MFGTRKLRALAILAVLLATSFAAPADAQYFGRNKVRHRTFHFEILKTEHFDIHYYAEERAAAETAGRMAERWYARLSRVLGHELSARQTIILYASHPHFEQTNAISGELDESTGGVTESVKRRVVLPMAATMTDTDHVLGHELVHAFQYDITGRSGQNPIALRLPLWFIEGMAEYLSLGPSDAHTAMWMRDAAMASDLPDFGKLDDYRYFPYRYGHAFWAYVAGRYGDAAVPTLLKSAGALDLRLVYGVTLGVDPDSLILGWKRFLKDNAALQKSSVMPSVAAHRLLGGSGRSDRKLFLAPSLSPDGREVAFLSERDFYTIDLYVADAHTGRVLRKLTKTSVDPHYQSLQFTGSSGSWSPDGKRFAFGAVHEGKALLSVIDVKSGRRLEDYASSDLGEVLNSSWSPDGKQVVFSALAGGQSDLYIATMGSPRIRRITHDLYGDLQPSWSPDGSRIVFVTERFSGNLDSLSLHRPTLAMLDVATDEITPVPPIGNGKHVSPQWSKDGHHLFFVADPDGISNLYEMDLDSGTHEKLTDLMTGVSGLTALSPTLSVARNVGRLAFSAYENGSFGIFAMDSIEHLPSRAEREDQRADLLAPPFERDVARWAIPDSLRAQRDPFAGDQGFPPAGFDPRTGERRAEPDSVRLDAIRRSAPDSTLGPPPGPRPSLAGLLADSRLGLPDTTSFSHSVYKPRLSLDRISQIDLGVGAVGSHFAASGGASVYWSDMLGDHHMLTFLQVQGEQGSIARSIAAGLAYFNMGGRKDWGFQLTQVPYLSREFQLTSITLPTNEPGYEERENRFWQTERTAIGTISYPISRVQRWELALGFQNVDFVGESVVRTYDQNGRLISAFDAEIPQRSSLNLGLGSVAWVYDTGLFGGTSPILGQRARLEASPVIGTLSYTSILVDLRQYVMPVRPITLAGRVMHYGRYGSDSENPVLIPLYIGAPYLVRGYDDASFSVGECVDGDCQAYNQLFGSKLAVANAEVRFPLLGPFGMLRTPLLPPIEVAAFFDAGSAWTETNRAQFLGGTRNIVTSQGIAVRFSLFGYFIAELDYVKPNDRPLKDPYWMFTFQPGF